MPLCVEREMPMHDMNRRFFGCVRGALCAVLAAGGCYPVSAQSLAPVRPLAWFVQAGSAGGGDTLAATVGVTADWGWQKAVGIGLLTGTWEASVGHWRTERTGQSDRQVWQFGVTPALRLYTSGARSGFFGEIGIGANVLTPRYERGDKEFSTKFNFGDHIGAGYRFGAQGENELTLRIQHYSNASIKKPNPGENFLQLRYARHFD